MPTDHWMPERHHSVVATLAHVDEIIAAVGDLVFEFQSGNHGNVSLREDTNGPFRHLVVESISPIPPKVPLLAADAFNSLRAALEHTVFIEAEIAEGGALDADKAKQVTMPATNTYDKFAKWNRDRRSRGPAALRPGAELNRRIHWLQPFHRHADPAAHPLARLVAYSNHSKHRMPAVTAVQIPVIHPEDIPLRSLRDFPRRPQRPIAPGDVLFTAPGNEMVFLSVFPSVGINIPDTNRWPVLMKELGEIAAWVREYAIPFLITGTHSVSPKLPPWYDISCVQSRPDTALTEGARVSAYDRGIERIKAATARQNMTITIAMMEGSPSLPEVSEWLGSLSDSDILTRMAKLIPDFSHDTEIMLHNYGVLQDMCTEAAAFAQTRSQRERRKSHGD